ncbi:hypothetical protein BDY24DRAFT_404523 [Mrakia frigida]|uniref:uncharacterized protein n=1 Tax=Mrakia frigida TaxID=29902 RepID=UPI003FCC0DEE
MSPSLSGHVGRGRGDKVKIRRHDSAQVSKRPALPSHPQPPPSLLLFQTMKLTALALLLVPTSILALSGEAPHRLDRSSISRTQEKKDNLPNHLESRQPCHGGIKKAEGGFLQRFGGGGGGREPRPSSLAELWDQWMGKNKDRFKIYGEAEKIPMDSDLIYILPIDLDASLVSDVEVELPAEPTELRTGHAHAHGHHHHHQHKEWKSSFAGRLDRAIEQLEPAEAAFLSFVFGFGLMSLFGMLFTITRRLVVRNKACKARRAAAVLAAASPPAYVVATTSTTKEKVALEEAIGSEEVLVLLEHQ